MTARVVLALLAALTIAALSGCATSDDAAGTAGSDGAAAEAVQGTWRAADPDTAWLTFDDGSVTGSDGCNPVNGSYTVTGDEIAFDLELTTLKACVGVTLSFRNLASASIAADALTVYDDQHAEIVTLARG